MVKDANRKPTMLLFELVHGKSPLIKGQDVKRYADTIKQGK